MKAEDVIKAFQDFGISKGKFELFTGMRYNATFHYIMSFAKKKTE